MDHNEATRTLERLFEKEANRAQEAVTELEALVLHLPDKPRQLAQAQIKASHKKAKEFRELALRSKEK
jgi:Skp family chaperone for outer membrane proteins